MGESLRRVLLVGATGRTGRMTAKALQDRGWTVRALVRDIAAAQAIIAQPVEFVTGRLQMQAVIEDAVTNVRAVVFMASGVGAADSTTGDIDFQGVARLAAAAERAGVGHFVLLSSASVTHPEHPHNPTYGNVLRMKLKGEDSLRSQAIPHTIVRALGLRDRVGALHGVRLVQGDRIAFGEDIARADVASFLADVVDVGDANRDALRKSGFQRDFRLESIRNATFEIYNDQRIPGSEWHSGRRSLATDDHA